MHTITWPWRGLILLTALAACGGPPAPPDPPAVAACKERANDDPTVRQIRAMQAGTPPLIRTLHDDLQLALNRATAACLHAMGLAPPPGGVEPVRQPR